MSPTTTPGRPRRPARRPGVLLSVLLLVASLGLSASPAAAADADAEARFVALANAARADRGLPALQVRSDLQAAARQHSARMARQRRLYHNPDLGSEVGGYRRLGENVGSGRSADDLHAAFMRSAPHRANILSSDFTEIGVGVEWRDGTLWVTQVFRQPDGSSPPPPPPAREPAPRKTAPPAAPPPAPLPAAEADDAQAEEEPDAGSEPAPASSRLRLNFARVVSIDSGMPVPEIADV